jgi:hypothetical protein
VEACADLGTFSMLDRAFENMSIDVSLMTREERLARLEELLQGATQYLPLLEQYENERAEKPDSEPNDPESRAGG